MSYWAAKMNKKAVHWGWSPQTLPTNYYAKQVEVIAYVPLKANC